MIAPWQALLFRRSVHENVAGNYRFENAAVLATALTCDIAGNKDGIQFRVGCGFNQTVLAG